MQWPSVREVKDGVERHEVLNSASAMAFQVLFALVPLALVLLALVGFFDVDRFWQDASAELEPQMSEAAFTVVDDTVRRIISEQQWFWLSLGLALALWRMSAAMRATMHALDLIYETRPGGRSFWRGIAVSIALSLAIGVLMLAALAVTYLGPVAVPVDGVVLGAASFVVRWGLAVVLLVVAIGLTIHYAPAKRQSLGWVSLGSCLCAVAWLVSTLLFGVYITDLANYGSVFGSFATLFVLMTYLYLSTTAFLIGAEIDAQLRRRHADEPRFVREDGTRRGSSVTSRPGRSGHAIRS